MSYKPSTMWTLFRQNEKQIECRDPLCVATPFSISKYKNDGTHYHDEGGPESFQEWYDEEGYYELLKIVNEEYETHDYTDLNKLARRAAQLAWDAAI